MLKIYTQNDPTFSLSDSLYGQWIHTQKLQKHPRKKYLKCFVHHTLIWRLDTPGSFLPFFTEEIFMTSCLLPCTPKLSEKGSTLKEKDLLPRETNSSLLKQILFHEENNNICEWHASVNVIDIISHYLKAQNTLLNTSKYLYLNISDLQNWGKNKSNNHISQMNM